VLDQKVPNRLVTDRGDLDELCETVSHLTDGKGAQQREVEESVERSVVSTESARQLLPPDSRAGAD
jgi:hypothetical protein